MTRADTDSSDSFLPEVMDDDAIIRRFLRHLKRVKTNPKPRWVRVMNATGHGSTVSCQLCVRFGFDPDELI